MKTANQSARCSLKEKPLVKLPILSTHDIPAASLHVCVCVCVITAICVHIPVLYITSTHSQLTMPKHRDAVSIAIETGLQPMRSSCLLGSVNIFFVVMEKWTQLACHVFVQIFILPSTVCVCDLDVLPEGV